MPHRVLISARDPAAAFHIIVIVQQVSSDSRFSLRVIAQKPAAAYLQDAGISFEIVDLPIAKKVDSTEAIALRKYAADVLTDFRPDVVLSGLSTPFDGGIDEAMLAEAQVPTFLMQDFWGEQNSFFGSMADTFLVLDEEAARLSRQRHAATPVIVGSPRHSVYAGLDSAQVRVKTRAKLNVTPETTVFGFFGQALHMLPGYIRTVHAWCSAISDYDQPCLAVYKPHPRESEDEVSNTLRLLESEDIDFVYLKDWCVEDALLCSDVVCSAFSNCTYDMAYLNYFSDDPLATPVALLFDSDVRNYFHQIVQLDELPYLKADLVLPAHEGDDLAKLLSMASTSEMKERFWRAAKTNLVGPDGATDRVLDAILKRLSNGA